MLINNLTRQASDAVLAGSYASGVLMISLMLV